MSRESHKNLKRGIKQSLVERVQRVRASRHGQPQMFNRKPMTSPRIVEVAAGPTGTWGKRNEAPKESAKKTTK